MDTTPEVLADEVRAKRIAVDNDLELLRVRMQQADPRRIDLTPYTQWARTAVPVMAGLGAAWMIARRRRSIGSLDGLLRRELSNLYATEQLLVPALQRMSARATDADVRQAFDQHRVETLGQIDRLERVFRSIGVRPTRGDAAAVEGVITDAERLLRRKMDRDVRDAWLIASAQRVEHIEIASYGTARTFADMLAYTPAAQLLQQTLDEERAADLKLTALAERLVNPKSIRG